MPQTLTIPAMLDPHVHLRDLDWQHKATFASETAAAVAGGYWAVLDMPNTPPTTTTHDALRLKRDRIAAQAVCDWGLYFGASQADNSAEYAAIIGQVCGLKIYNNATTGSLLIEDQALRERHVRAWRDARSRAAAPRPIAVHAEEETVADILALVRRYRVPTHFCHISTAGEIAQLAAAKAEGLPVSVGVTPHHLFLTADDVHRLGALGRMKPELKTQADQDALWAGIASGVVDVVESDHAPHTLAEKAASEPPSGVPGLETTLPLLLTAAHQGRLTYERVIELVATRPCQVFGLTPPADTCTVVDCSATYTITRNKLHTSCGWSPFEGMTVTGRVREVWRRGQRVYDGEQVLAAPGAGRGLFGEEAGS